MTQKRSVSTSLRFCRRSVHLRRDNKNASEPMWFRGVAASMGLSDDLQLATKFSGVQMQVFEALGRREDSKLVLDRYQTVMHDFITQEIGGRGMSAIELMHDNIKSFDRVARKYGIDYAVKKDKTCEPPKYFVFFKARDQESMISAFKEFVDLNTRRQNRKSFKDMIGNFKEMAKSVNKQFDKVKNRHQEQSL